MIKSGDKYKHRLTGTTFIVHRTSDLLVFVYRENLDCSLTVVHHKIFNRDYVREGE